MPQPQEIKRKKKGEQRKEKEATQRRGKRLVEKKGKKEKKKEKQCSEAHLQFVHGHFCHLAIRFPLSSFLLIFERKLFGGRREKTLKPHLVIDIFVENLKKKNTNTPLNFRSNQTKYYSNLKFLIPQRNYQISHQSLCQILVS